MMRALGILAVALTAAAAPTESPMFQLSSPAFASSAAIPKKYTCDGRNVSPPLAWTGQPAGAAFVAVVMEDPDAPAGLWIHWVLYDVPARDGAVSENLTQAESFPNGSKQGQSGGVVEFEAIGYSGPCPPPGPAHRYVFRAYALSASTGLAPRASKAALEAAMKGKILARAELVGTYGR